jgi:hypothetical protein
MTNLMKLERRHGAARDAFDAAARAPDITKPAYDKARDASIAAMRAYHDALEADWRTRQSA